MTNSIHRAYLGDWSAISDGILSDARDDSDFSFGLFFSITCSEDIPFIREDEVAAETEGTFLGDYRVRQQQAACRRWPKASLPEGYREPVQSSVPTVFASGDTDGGTPLWFMEHTAKGFSHRLEVVLHGQGHTEWNECIAKIYQKVVISDSVGDGGTSTCPCAAWLMVWAIATKTWNGPDTKHAVVYAFDATKLGEPIYNSEQNSQRDRAALAARFVIPIVVNGRVYFGTRSEVEVYGLVK